ncbi:TonB-dependent receptor [Sphingobium terrigena]|uniref:TonB-dependent receptor n=2 Tax=Sphingobium terrigena TaxID=2304063 RepID=A0A418YPF7_9SPHN|nr:TonB-dependent receptor [Sphingobium terrigena]
MRRFRVGVCAGAVAASLLLSSASWAQDSSPRDYDVASQDLKYALRDMARQSGLELVAPSGDLRGKHAPALKGHYTPEQALAQLLKGTELVAEISGGTIYITGRAEAPRAAVADAAGGGADIVVTGSRIRGAEPASPLTQTTRSQIEGGGFTDLGSFARSIPQNYVGGQNPGVISSVQSGSENFNSSSTLNLRGLGPDATLTLLNGHRLAYDAVNQGIDISSIPLAAIERVDLVADGSSALYGSDAVGGVANIILRRDFEGVLASARFGAATDGGDVQHQSSAVTGHRWSTGGFMVAGDFNRSSSITAGQRSYTQTLQPNMSLLPSQREISGVVSGHQSLSPAVEFDIDGNINEHESRASLPFTNSADATQLGVVTTPKVFSYSISPSLKIDLPANWQLIARGSRAASDSKAQAAIYFSGSLFARNMVRYDNGLWSGELSGEGPVFTLPGGPVRVAVGAGIRSLSLVASVQQITSAGAQPLLAYDDHRTVAYGYGELSVPLVAEANDIPLVRRLQLSAAARYEHYSGIGGLATPKLGLIYKPFDDLTLKTSWGRSFKAPTLAQINQPKSVALVAATDFFPLPADNRNILLVSGGNETLKPEKASSWTATAELRPSSVPGLKVQLSRFEIHYSDRVVVPILDYTQAFSGTTYQNLILFNPTLAQVAAETAGLPLGVDNQTGGAYDPANVGAIIGNQYRNAARQVIKGFDFDAAYDFNIGRDNFNLAGTASYLKSRQRLSANQPDLQRAGVIFNPPHWRAQGSADWSHDVFTLTAVINYIGSTEDNRATPFVTVRDFVSVNAILRIKPKGSGLAAGLDIVASISNLFDEKPGLIRTSGGTSPNYDATNYPSIGRFISLTLTKQF